MNATMKARRAYSAAAVPTRTPRSLEYEVVAQVTHRIKAAAQRGTAGFSDLAQALHDNKRLWTLFARDLSDPENGLPAELKARLFYLAEFTFQHTSKVLAREDNVVPLLEVNAAILRGLKARKH
ncbi:flagellar biosynthesis regulator FlaF [Thalassococcus sp. S3]|uniref:flagellar biosynthesis regulator FlaF n=1 Tax=Thalassococcus sp. S3 TaxID=2017482 RepID=UPI0010246803|nr:flagellar biosynthesis regulator FlaF [Thalassococcus sp. S3]QBF29712.1 flagellar biosynthesis regulator FlhF [Thalassococcus sp. S3]